ncbi:hypothetical protein BRCH_01502 [Candidatus Burkholderia brachyanthoides]|nr:hypothetical protein BRCH_01502 [Candidatus Burkholderia brachyanthoides]
MTARHRNAGIGAHGLAAFEHLRDHLVLSAKIDSETPIFSVGNPIPVDQVIVMRAFAKVRGKAKWLHVDSRCGVRDGHVVGVSLTPNIKLQIVR